MPIIHINPSTTRPKLNEKVTTGVVTTRDSFLQVIKNLCMPTVQFIDTLKLLDIVLLLHFTKFKIYSFFVEWERFEIIFLFGILQDFCEFFSILY